MKAVLCKSYGPPENLVLEDVDTPSAGPGEVLIDVYAAGLNFPDVLQINGKYQFQPPFPFTPGSEVGGIVAEVGEGVTHVKPGDRVMAMAGVGGMAEQALAPAMNVRTVPDSMDLKTASGFGMIYGTSHYALKQRANLQAGETLLVLGASGGVGYAAVELGKVAGARVIAAASTDEKLQITRDAGADETINYSKASLKDEVKKLTGGVGADVVYDPVGGDLCEQALRATNWEGRLLIIGFASGVIPKLPANLALLKGCQIVGVFWGDWRRRDPETSDRNFDELYEMYEAGKLKPLVTQVYPLDQYAKALNNFVERKAVGKVVLEVRAE